MCLTYLSGSRKILIRFQNYFQSVQQFFPGFRVPCLVWSWISESDSQPYKINCIHTTIVYRIVTLMTNKYKSDKLNLVEYVDCILYCVIWEVIVYITDSTTTRMG